MLADKRDAEVLRSHVMGAYLTAYQGPEINATANEAAIETLTVTREGGRETLA